MNIEAKAKIGSGKKVFNIIIITLSKRQQHAEAIFDDSTTTMFEKVKKKYAICIIWVLVTDFPGPSSILASMFFHFEHDNDFAIRCIFTFYIYIFLLSKAPGYCSLEHKTAFLKSKHTIEFPVESSR
jgi:hypothetical protein